MGIVSLPILFTPEPLEVYLPSKDAMKGPFTRISDLQWEFILYMEAYKTLIINKTAKIIAQFLMIPCKLIRSAFKPPAVSGAYLRKFVIKKRGLVRRGVNCGRNFKHKAQCKYKKLINNIIPLYMTVPCFS